MAAPTPASLVAVGWESAVVEMMKPADEEERPKSLTMDAVPTSKTLLSSLQQVLPSEEQQYFVPPHSTRDS